MSSHRMVFTYRIACFAWFTCVNFPQNDFCKRGQYAETRKSPSAIRWLLVMWPTMAPLWKKKILNRGQRHTNNDVLSQDLNPVVEYLFEIYWFRYISAVNHTCGNMGLDPVSLHLDQQLLHLMDQLEILEEKRQKMNTLIEEVRDLKQYLRSFVFHLYTLCVICSACF